MDNDLTKTAVTEAPRQHARGLRLIAVAGGGISHHSLPAAGEVVLGRADDATIPLVHDQVSRRHAILNVGTTLSLQDLGSKNGTRVCGRQLAPHEIVEIAAGDVVQLGSVVLVVQTLDDDRRVTISKSELDDRLLLAQGPCVLARLRIEHAPPYYEDMLADMLAATDQIAKRDDGCELLLFGAGGPSTVERAIDRLRQAGATVRSGLARFPRDGRDPDCLRAVVDAALERNDAPRFGTAVELAEGPMREVYELAQLAARATLPVLLVGETGVGKEVIAGSIHRRSDRASGPYLCLNCAALPENMVESELFGHERGSFTGATRDKPGLLEAASGGMVLLDEIGELPLAIQAKLLRVLEAKEVMRIGSVKARPIDVRFLAATNRDLEADIQAGRFRKDLYFRLKGLVIAVPPLRERRVEIRRLAQVFLDELCRATGRRIAPAWSPAALAVLDGHPWPGNVRELRNTVERALVLCSGATITPVHLPLDMTSACSIEPDVEAQLRSKLDQLERERIEDALASCNGNQSQAAKRLGIARNTLIARLEEYGLARPRKKPRD